MNSLTKINSHSVLVIIILQALSCVCLTRRGSVQSVTVSPEILNDDAAVIADEDVLKPLPQLNCTKDPSICTEICGEPKSLPYSATFCSGVTGSCVCDCRDRLKKECVQTPFTPCFQDCVRANPNPDRFLYRGGNCHRTTGNGTVAYQCACECSVRHDSEETNQVY